MWAALCNTVNADEAAAWPTATADKAALESATAAADCEFVRDINDVMSFALAPEAIMADSFWANALPKLCNSAKLLCA